MTGSAIGIKSLHQQRKRRYKMKTEQILADLTAELKADNDKAELKEALHLILNASREQLRELLDINNDDEEYVSFEPMLPVKRDYWQEGLNAEYENQIKLETMMGDI